MDQKITCNLHRFLRWDYFNQSQKYLTMNFHFLRTGLSFIFLFFFFQTFVAALHAQTTLTYQRLTSGLDFPDFEEGKTDFAFDDVNMDGHTDILTVGDHGSPFFNSEQHGICVWFGDGQGSFTNFMNGNFGYGGIAVGDVNNDGHKDVGYGIHHNYSGSGWGDQLIEVVLGDGTGMNWELYDEDLATAGETWGMFGTAFADFNNDGFLDLVSVSFGGGSGLQVYLNNQDGTWDHSFGFLGGSSGLIVRVGDINNDGYIDFLANHSLGKAYFGDGAGNFTINDTGLPTSGTSYSGLDIARSTLHGSFGISYTNSSGGVKVYFWNNDNQLWTDFSGNLPISGPYQFSQLHDMNNDGFLDVMAFGNQQFQLWLGDDQSNWVEDAAMTTTGDPGSGNSMRAGGDLDHNGFPDLLFLAQKWTGSFIQILKNELFVFAESSPADSLWIKPLFPTGGENFYPGSAQFIQWISEVPAETQSTVTIEISAFGQEGPWWLLAEDIPNNGNHQWIVPDYGSENVFLRFTVNGESAAPTATTSSAFNIFGLPTAINSQNHLTQISIYPNPAKDVIFLNNCEICLSISLSDLTGKQVYKTLNPKNQIILPELKPGAYFYTVWLKNGKTENGKLIILSE
jgi:hypothetical protein